MAATVRRKNYRKLAAWTAGILLTFFAFLLIFVDRFVEPLLKDRIHTLIIQGSDSLYTYTLGNLKANFFGGNVEVENLQISVDSARYEQLRQRNALPALTMQLSLGKGQIKGLKIFSLLFGKNVQIDEIMSKDADIKLSRHVVTDSAPPENVPLWRSIRPKIQSIDIERIRLDGIKMNYKNADTSESVKIEFEGCNALFSQIHIDSTAAFDTTRIGFAKAIDLRFSELKYRTPDSSYKIKAMMVHYSSVSRVVEIDSFKFQPTLEPEVFFTVPDAKRNLFDLRFHKARLTSLRLDYFIRRNIIEADSMVIDQPIVTIETDKHIPAGFESKIGKYPHQLLQKANLAINIRHLVMRDGTLNYTEQNEITGKTGKMAFTGLQMDASNVTNDPRLIKIDPVFKAGFAANLFGNSPLKVDFQFRLDSTNGSFTGQGNIKNVGASQLNTVADPLGNVVINSLILDQFYFDIRGQDYDALTTVGMRYHNLALTIKKTDEETGQITTRKFITKLLNKFVIWPDNPGPDGVERVVRNKKVLRLTTQSFFNFLWKVIFSGMQDVIMKSGQYNG
jgi:hypothetical protein